MIGEIITGGLGLIGSLFGKKKQTTTSTVNYYQMAKKAAEAGFNPLTAIRNGGSAGFTTTTSPTASMLPEALANLGGVLGPALRKQLDPMEAKKRQLDTALVDYQLRQLKNTPATSGSTMLRPGSTFSGVKTSAQISPTVGPSSKRVANVPSAYVKPGQNAPGEGKHVGGQDPTISSLGFNNGRYGWFHNPVLPDAEVAETVYGDNEINSTLYSAGKYLGDTGYSIYRNLKSANEDYGDSIRKKVPKPASKYLQPSTRNAGSAIGSMFKPKRKARWEDTWQKSLQ